MKVNLYHVDDKFVKKINFKNEKFYSLSDIRRKLGIDKIYDFYIKNKLEERIHNYEDIYNSEYFKLGIYLDYKFKYNQINLIVGSNVYQIIREKDIFSQIEKILNYSIKLNYFYVNFKDDYLGQNIYLIK